MHLEDLMEHISASYPNIWALTGLHFNDNVNYQLASYFKSRYTIYYQHGSNRFGGVCLVIAREVPHRIASEFKDINNLIVVDVFNSNKKYTVAVVYSPPSEEVPIDILNRLYRYNRNLILIGDLNARHFNWHDVTSNSCGHRLAEWIEAKPNLKIFNSAKPTSIRSRAVIDLIIAPSHVSSELADIDQKMRVTDHYPVHWRLSSFKSHSSIEYEVKRIDWVVLNSILNLKQNFFFTLSEQMRHEPNDLFFFTRCFFVPNKKDVPSIT
jgi:Endonuclease-reverse transcriptase